MDGKRTLEIDAEEAEVVRTIYKLYLDGNGNGNKLGFMRIAEYLTERQIPTPADKGNTINDRDTTEYGVWDHSVLRRMVKSRVYPGEWQYGKHTDNPITIPVPRIISDEVWDAAQVIRKKNHRVRKHPGDYDFLLKGMATCSVCGKRMQLNSYRHRKTPLYYYKHPQKLRNDNGRRCSGHGYFRADDVDKLLWGYAEEILSNPDELAGGFRKYAERLKSGNNPTRDKLGAAQKQVASAERELSRLVHLYMKEKITETQYDEMKKTLDIQLEKHSEDVDTLSQELEQSAKLEDHMQSITKFAEVAAAKLNTKYAAKIENRREVVRRMGLQAEFARQGRKKYADAVFCFADNVRVKGRATYSVLFISEN